MSVFLCADGSFCFERFVSDKRVDQFVFTTGNYQGELSVRVSNCSQRSMVDIHISKGKGLVRNGVCDISVDQLLAKSLPDY